MIKFQLPRLLRMSRQSRSVDPARLHIESARTASDFSYTFRLVVVAPDHGRAPWPSRCQRSVTGLRALAGYFP